MREGSLGGLQEAVDRLACARAGGLGISMGTTAAARVELLVVDRASSNRPAESAATVSSNLVNRAKIVCRMSPVASDVEEVVEVIFLVNILDDT